MNGIIIEVQDYPKADEVSSPQPDLLENMKQAYVYFFENNYEPKLQKDSKNETISPQLSVIIDEEVYEITFDVDLFQQLCEIYIIEGWQGIVEIEKNVNQVTKNDSQELSGGIKDKKWRIDVFPKETKSWDLAKNFFTLTKKMLALLIRESLIKIEKLSAERIILKLSLTNIEIAKAWDKYKIDYTYPKETIEKGGGSLQRPETKVYTIDEPSLATDLFNLLTLAVAERDKFDKIVKDLIDTQENLASKKEFRQYESSEIADLEKKEKETINLKIASENLLKTLNKLFETQHPLGLLIYGSLKKDFKQPEMENLFGLTIDNLRKDLESIASKIDPTVSKINQLFPFKKSKDIMRDIFNFQIPNGGLEKFVLETSLKNYKEVSFQPMLAEENLNQLFDKEVISADSFETIVGFHYLSDLILKLGEIQNEEQKVKDFWETIGKVSAALSLAALLIPQARLILGGVETIANLALVAYTVNSVTENLRKNDDLVKTVLINQGEFSTDFLVQVGEVVAVRKEFADNLTIEIAKEIFNVFGGSKLPIFKQYLLARNYYYDFETLVEAD